MYEDPPPEPTNTGPEGRPSAVYVALLHNGSGARVCFGLVSYVELVNTLKNHLTRVLNIKHDSEEVIASLMQNRAVSSILSYDHEKCKNN